ncbi:ead/Ea22-like family protein [Pseudomonas aeruginosa]
MTYHAELRRVAEAATPGPWEYQAPLKVLAADRTWIVLIALSHANYREDEANSRFIATANPKTVLALLDEIDRLKAENEELRGALQAVEAEVDGNLRPLTRDLVNMVSGLKNGSHPNDIYEHCDEIERIIGAALEGDKP